ncbi:MAG: type II toxin-antitoxin system RelE/ParE family toxin [Verrucomicrobiaceae bacterium]|nr:MAG: type II toxin-antitoxin system RelE/ParE family toxin [Verrucomicrobiaceae bacterium]
MNDYALTPSAEIDLQKIRTYIAADIFAACQLLADNPQMGYSRPAWTEKPVRFWIVRRHYLIVYAPQGQPLQIQRIIHAARNIPKLLEEEGQE